MISFSLCNTCLQPYKILRTPDTEDLLKLMIGQDGLVACPRLCGGKISVANDETVTAMAKDPRLKTPISVNVTDLFKAIHGGGLPDEIPVGKDVVELLLGTKVESIVTDSDEAGNLYLNEIVFENGRVLHLTSGLKGAQVLKITKMSPGATNGIRDRG